MALRREQIDMALLFGGGALTLYLWGRDAKGTANVLHQGANAANGVASVFKWGAVVGVVAMGIIAL